MRRLADLRRDSDPLKAGKEKDQAREGIGIRGAAGDGCAPLLSAAGSPRGRHSGREKVNPDLLFRLFLRSKSLVQDSILGPEYNVFWVCPAAFPPPLSCSPKARQARNDDHPQALAVSFLTAEIAAIRRRQSFKSSMI